MTSSSRLARSLLIPALLLSMQGLRSWWPLLMATVEEDKEPIVETITFLQGVSVLVSVVKNQGLCGSCSAFFLPQAIGFSWCLTPRGSHCSVDLMPTSPVLQYFPHFSWRFRDVTVVKAVSIRDSAVRAGCSLVPRRCFLSWYRLHVDTDRSRVLLYLCS